MNIVDATYTGDLEGAVSILRQYGDVCVLWKGGMTASFRWLPSRADHSESMESRINDIARMELGF